MEQEANLHKVFVSRPKGLRGGPQTSYSLSGRCGASAALLWQRRDVFVGCTRARTSSRSVDTKATMTAIAFRRRRWLNSMCFGSSSVASPASAPRHIRISRRLPSQLDVLWASARALNHSRDAWAHPPLLLHDRLVLLSVKEKLAFQIDASLCVCVCWRRLVAPRPVLAPWLVRSCRPDAAAQQPAGPRMCIVRFRL